MESPSAAGIRGTLGPSCRDTGRRAALLTHGALNGIDFVEYSETTAGRHVLDVHFLLPGTASIPLPGNPALFRVHGGTRVTGIDVVAPIRPGTDPRVLQVTVDRQGDFSPYLLAIGWSQDEDGAWHYDLLGVDRLFSVAPVNFRPGCAVDFDCATTTDCPQETLTEPALDYLARDYASLRQMLLDLVTQRNPDWTERSPADIGIALLELFAYEGDQLSYFQDAVANEAYLDTARQRTSAKRHAKFVDYTMHDGRNAWTYVQFKVSGAGTIGPGEKLLTRITEPLRYDRRPAPAVTVRPAEPPSTILSEVLDEDFRTDPALTQVRVFETATSAAMDPRCNELRIHTWGNEECCLPRGTTTAHLYAVTGTVAVAPPLKAGDHLLLEEVLGPLSGAAADADPAHRQVVRVERVTGGMHDPLFLAAIDETTGEPRPAPPATPTDDTLPVVEVSWSKADGLTFPLCLSAKPSPDRRIRRVSVARGNIVLADHGLTVVDEIRFDPRPEGDPPVRLRLLQGPLTMQCQPPGSTAVLPPVPERPELRGDVRDARPAVAVRTLRGKEAVRWSPVPDLLTSGEFSHHFVADVDDAGRAVLRFGDGEYGERFVGVDAADVWYRVGNGHSGNIGPDALAHIVGPPAKTWPVIESLRNPVPGRDGVDPELIEEVRQYAPTAFRSRRFRAVTEQDYVDAALGISGVAGAVATFRWTGSWHTVFVGIDPADPEHVTTGTTGDPTLTDAFRDHVRDELSRYRLAGYDVEIRGARYVPIDLAVELCVTPGYFRGDVAHAVSEALTGRTGRPGFFDPSRFTFGQPVHLSRIYAVVQDVEGVESATVTEFRRHDRPQGDELDTGVLTLGPWEIARLDNDPSDVENGTLIITAGGGS